MFSAERIAKHKANIACREACSYWYGCSTVLKDLDFGECVNESGHAVATLTQQMVCLRGQVGAA